MLNYSHLMGEEYEQKRKAVLEYTCGDVVKTTEVLDLLEENEILSIYSTYCQQSFSTSGHLKDWGDAETDRFFVGLDYTLEEDVLDL